MLAGYTFLIPLSITFSNALPKTIGSEILKKASPTRMRICSFSCQDRQKISHDQNRGLSSIRLRNRWLINGSEFPLYMGNSPSDG
jgi:hypothetical protein